MPAVSLFQRGHSECNSAPGSRAAGVAMTFKLIESAQQRWRAVNHPTSSLSSGPEPGSRRASWSNVPTSQEAISRSHDTPIRQS
jgi:hypothetical protein